MIYAVECVHCQETLLTTAQIGDAEARIVADDDPGLAEILHRVRVTNR